MFGLLKQSWRSLPRLPSAATSNSSHHAVRCLAKHHVEHLRRHISNKLQVLNIKTYLPTKNITLLRQAVTLRRISIFPHVHSQRAEDALGQLCGYVIKLFFYRRDHHNVGYFRTLHDNNTDNRTSQIHGKLIRINILNRLLQYKQGHSHY